MMAQDDLWRISFLDMLIYPNSSQYDTWTLLGLLRTVVHLRR